MKFSWRYTFLVATVLALGIWGVAVNVPNTFTAGDTISSAEVNANFDVLETAVTANETAITSINSSVTNLNESLARFGSTGFQDTTFDNSVDITSSTFVALASLNIPAVSNVNISFSAHFYAEKSRSASTRYEFQIVKGDCASTDVIGSTFWRPANDGDTGSTFVADVLSMTGFDADVSGPATYTLCGSKFDAGVDISIGMRGFNAIWTP
jgi:hypothetical protein